MVQSSVRKIRILRIGESFEICYSKDKELTRKIRIFQKGILRALESFEVIVRESTVIFRILLILRTINRSFDCDQFTANKFL
ncbi:hypothetical protein HanXRQr2_Chr09g0390301 [Helianthus annuus]|uniref:Uncharacterized protein n=1 Tax=Helianthus annuus TaxID=4232 RepID=A0A9K3I6H2_HELAN|nr:hypothetical protein HanXRQr2_Chr09g0390301 [Helianthus annuus]